MHRWTAFLSLALLCVASVQAKKKNELEDAVKKDGAVPRSHETYADPCSCALLNFWDIKPREDATTCCQALQELCDQSNSTLHCGHVYRFCLKRRAGYSAYILDEFVRTELRDLECDAFNPHATHENEKCGGGFCRIGYTCATVKAQKCFADGGLVCGDGYCNSGAECAEMSSQTCKRFKEDDLDKKKLKNYDEPTCSKGVCEACQTMTEYKCAFKRGMREPCKEKGCARGRRCVDVEEEVCVVRPDAAQYLNGAETHDPEKVKKKFRRFTAVVLPVVGCIVAAISVIAFVSWSTIRVRRARKELGFEYESDNETPRGPGDNDVVSKADRHEKDVPLSPRIKRPTFTQNAAQLANSVADILSPRLRLSVGQSPRFEDQHTPLSSSHTPQRGGGGRLFTPRNYETLDTAGSTSDAEMTPRERNFGRSDQ